MKTQTLMEKAPVEWEKIIDKIKVNERRGLAKELEGISKRAGILAAYIEERYGYGCGDQGHEAAVKKMNRAGKMIHMKVFGYTAYHNLNI